MYEWTLPIGKTLIKWKPLTVGVEMDVQAMYRLPENQHLQSYELLRRCIVQYGEKNAPPELGEFRSWDSLDLDLFSEEVIRIERERKAAFAKGSDSPLAKS